MISDMYLPEPVVKKLLLICDPFLASIKLYLSSTYGFMKLNRSLYNYVKQVENVEFDQWIHFGDNKTVDFENARKLGIQASLYDYVKLEAYENCLLNNLYKDPYIQLSIGLSKNLRLNTCGNSQLEIFGVSYAGPVLYAYVYWLLTEANQLNISRLYFVARDGYILKIIADIIINQLSLPISTKYIYASRKSLRLCGASLNRKVFNQVLHNLQFDLKNIDKNLGLSISEIEGALSSSLQSYKNFDELYECLMASDQLYDLVKAKNEVNVSNAVSYLRQEIDTTNDNFAFVDLDGSGLTQNCLSSLINSFHVCKINTFYMAVTPLCYETINVNRYYYMMLKRPLQGKVMELLVRAPHGQTLSYERKDNKIYPILEKTSGKVFNLQENFESYLNGISLYAKYFSLINNSYCNVNRFLVDKYLNFVLRSIDKKTADILGSIIHHDNPNTSDVSEYAKEFNFIDAIKYLFLGLSDSEDLKFSMARSSKLIQKIIKKKNNSLLTKIFNVTIDYQKKKAYLILLGLKFSFRHLIFKI